MTVRARAIVFTALELESDAVAAHLKGVEYVRHESFVWRRGVFDEGLGWEIVIVQTEPENAVAGPVVASALAAIGPAVALFIGVAGGVEAKGVAALDLVVPAVVEYLHAGQAGATFVPRSRQTHPSRYMIQAARALANHGGWISRMDAPPEPLPKVRFDALASGEQVVKSLDSDTYAAMMARNDKTIAVDMEATGFFNASGLHDHLQHLVVRGISDLISDKDAVQDSQRQPQAAALAAAFGLELLATMPVDVLTLRDQPLPLSPFGVRPASLGDQLDPPLGESLEPDTGDAPAENPVHGLVLDLATELADLLDLDNWHLRTEGLFWGVVPSLSVDYDSQLETAIAWLTAHVAVPIPDAFAAALTNLHRVLEDFRLVFHQHLELDRSGAVYRTISFYRDYERSIIEREELVADFRHHTSLVKNLGAEATRAINLISDVVRAHHAPQFRMAEGAAGIISGDEYVVLTYTPAERAEGAPYPGLADFPGALQHRDGAFAATEPQADWPEDLAAQLQEAVAAKSIDAATSLAYRLAQTLADGLPADWSVTIKSGHERSFDVRFRVVSVRWRFADGTQTVVTVPHLARTYMSPHGPDERREALVGVPQSGAIGETIEPRGGRLMDSLSTQELLRFSREADSLVRSAGGGRRDEEAND